MAGIEGLTCGSAASTAAATEFTAEDEAAGKRMADKVKAWLHGMDIERSRTAARTA